MYKKSFIGWSKVYSYSHNGKFNIIKLCTYDMIHSIMFAAKLTLNFNKEILFLRLLTLDSFSMLFHFIAIYLIITSLYHVYTLLDWCNFVVPSPSSWIMKDLYREFLWTVVFLMTMSRRIGSKKGVFKKSERNRD